MPKLYEYLGIVTFFYSNEHYPIHVHARKGEYETKASFIIVEGKIECIIFSIVHGKKALLTKDQNKLKDFLEIYAEKIVQKWIDYFVYNKKVDFETISNKV